MSDPVSRLAPYYFQVAYVVREIEAAENWFKQVMGVPTERISLLLLVGAVRPAKLSSWWSKRYDPISNARTGPSNSEQAKRTEELMAENPGLTWRDAWSQTSRPPLGTSIPASAPTNEQGHEPVS